MEIQTQLTPNNNIIITITATTITTITTTAVKTKHKATLDLNGDVTRGG